MALVSIGEQLCFRFRYSVPNSVDIVPHKNTSATRRTAARNYPKNNPLYLNLCLVSFLNWNYAVIHGSN